MASYIYEFGKLLECPVCFEIFENPKSLWCGHVLCLKCFKQLVTYNFLQCPLCRNQTRCVRNGPPSLYIVHDFIQLFEKEKESQKYLAAILPILPKKSNQNKLPLSEPREDSEAGSENAGADYIKKLICLDCKADRKVVDVWICADCSYRCICSRCGLKHHKSHDVILFVELIDQRKLIVAKWRESHTMQLEIVYRNRTDVEFYETRIKLLILQVESKKVSPSDAEDKEFAFVEQRQHEIVAVEQLTTKSKGNFASLRERVKMLLTPTFLSGPEDNFANELKNLPTVIDNLLCEQEIVLQIQKRLLDELSETLGLTRKASTPAAVTFPTFQSNGRRTGQHRGRFRAPANSNNRFR